MREVGLLFFGRVELHLLEILDLRLCRFHGRDPMPVLGWIELRPCRILGHLGILALPVLGRVDR